MKSPIARRGSLKEAVEPPEEQAGSTPSTPEGGQGVEQRGDYLQNSFVKILLLAGYEPPAAADIYKRILESRSKIDREIERLEAELSKLREERRLVDEFLRLVEPRGAPPNEAV